ncbi:unnamed protein product [Rotaria sordida]|uniref:Calmodulin-binding domain-containing protein n=1 Tax=Rotaria sordida TaxID=392033 RepID=A0A815QYT2_9BILA|nr:unnamed protein product [Rotaria sordida]CAF1469767.1 unnamed protein product [Rotaria sordida]
MANIEDTCISLTNPIEADSSSATKLSDSLDIVILPSTTTITTNSNVSNNKEIHPRSVKKQKIADNILLSNISRRLAIRKNLHKRLSFVTDIMCFLGILGIILMIIENEIKFSQINNNDTMSSWCIKIVISCSTIILIGFIFQYHRLKLFLYAVNNSIQDSRVTLTNRKIFLIILEILICAIHPVPHSIPPYLKASLNNIDSNSSTSTPYILSYIDIDVALGLPMFARFYLICRSIVFHSHLFRDSSSRSIGYLNRVSIDFLFLIKTYLEQWPIGCLTTLCLIFFIVGSWCLRACNYLPTNEHVSFLDSMWLFVVTFTTVGYGDFTPSTYCGRSITAIISMVGVFSTALVIAVLAQQLLLDRCEKYVHNFVMNIELAKEHKIQAANVVKFAVKVWYIENKNISLSSIRYLQVRRRLFQAIHLVQQVKQERGKLIDNRIDQIDLLTMQRKTNAQTYETKEQLKTMKVKIDNIEEKLIEMNTNINNTVNDIQKTLNILSAEFLK